MSEVKKVKLSEAQKNVIEVMRGGKPVFKCTHAPYRYEWTMGGKIQILNGQSMRGLRTLGLIVGRPHTLNFEMIELTPLGRTIEL